MAHQHVGRISEFHFNEVRQLMRGRDADVGKHTRSAEPVLAVYPNSLRRQPVLRDVLKTAQIAAELLQKEPELAEMTVRLRHEDDGED